MLRTYPICQSPAHRHPESLRGIIRRLERDLDRDRQRGRVASPPRIEAPTLRRFAF